MNILICDDDPHFLQILKVHVQEYMSIHFFHAEIFATTDPFAVLLDKTQYDIAFLDIQMDEVDGISLGKELKNRNVQLVLFFVTNYNEYIDTAMDLNAFRYFQKPFDVNRLHSGLDKAMEYLDRAYIYVFAQSNSENERLLTDSILYVTREKRRVLIHTLNGTYYSKDAFDALCEKLSPAYFYLVHNSFFVNLHHIQKYSYSELYMMDGTRIPIASRKQSGFHKFWFEYLRRH